MATINATFHAKRMESTKVRSMTEEVSTVRLESDTYKTNQNILEGRPC